MTVPTSTGSVVKNPDVAYDSTSNSYLAVTGSGKVQGAWITPGAALASATFNLTPSTAFQQSPSAACGENGVCLVVWHEGNQGSRPMARILSKAGGFLSSPVALGPLGSSWEMAAGIAYSPSANVFMVTWMGEFLSNRNILIAIVNLSGQVTYSAHVTTDAAYEREPSIGFNPVTGQFVVVYEGVVFGGAYAYVRAQRIGPGGALIGGPIQLVQAGAAYISSIDFNTRTQSMLVTWNQGSNKIFGRQLNNDGTIGPLLTISSTYGAYDALDSAYNPNTKSFLVVTHGLSVEDVGLEVSSANVTLGVFTLTNDGGSGSFNPRVAPSTAGNSWMAATSRNYASLVVQAASSTTDAGLGGALPPPPPPGCSVSTTPASASVAAAGGTGNISVTVSASPCSWTATTSAAWLTVSPGSGTAAATVKWTAVANGTTSARSGTVTIAGHVTTVSQAAASGGTGGTGGGTVTGSNLNMQFDGAGGGDFATYNASTGAFAVRLYDGSPFTTSGAGTLMAGWQMWPAKFDSGGLTDLFFYNPTSGAWRKAINIGGGTFSAYFPPTTLGTGWSVTVLDLNGDGISDVFLYNPTTGAWKRCISSSPGGTDFTYTTGTWATGWTVRRARFNTDGHDDLLLYRPAGTTAGQWARALSQADGTFSVVAGTTNWGVGMQVYTGDFDGNGLTDAFLYRPSDGHTELVTFTATTFTTVTSALATGWTVHAGDINGDGKTDLFLYNSSTGRWVVLTSSAGWFALNQTGVLAGTGWDLRVLYLDGDAKADVLWYKPSTGATRVWITQSPTAYTLINGPTIATGFTLVP